jgi:UDP-glucose 4-epimerase
MSPFTAVPQLVHAAARGIAPDFSALRSPAHADDGFDMCYVKDCARAIDQAPATAVTPSLLPRKA